MNTRNTELFVIKSIFVPFLGFFVDVLRLNKNKTKRFDDACERSTVRMNDSHWFQLSLFRNIFYFCAMCALASLIHLNHSLTRAVLLLAFSLDSKELFKKNNVNAYRVLSIAITQRVKIREWTIERRGNKNQNYTHNLFTIGTFMNWQWQILRPTHYIYCERRAHRMDFYLIVELLIWLERSLSPAQQHGDNNHTHTVHTYRQFTRNMIVWHQQQLNLDLVCLFLSHHFILIDVEYLNLARRARNPHILTTDCRFCCRFWFSFDWLRKFCCQQHAQLIESKHLFDIVCWCERWIRV